MHEEQQIYDSPQQPTYQPQQAVTPIDRTVIKKTLIDAFQILSQPSPAQSALTKCHKTITQYHKLPQILQIFFELILQFSPHNQTLTKLIITQIFTYMKKQSSFGYEERHDRVKINKLFLQFFVESGVDYKFKKMIENTYMQFIYAAQNVKLREIVVKYVDDKLTQIFSTTKNSYAVFEHYNKLSSPISIMIPPEDIATKQNLNTCCSLIHVLKCLFVGGNLQIELMKTILPNCFSIYYIMTQEIAKGILYAIQTKQEVLFVAKVDQCAKFTELLILMFSKLDSGKYPQLRERMLHTREFYRLVLILLNLSTQFHFFEAVQLLFKQPLYSQGKQLTHQQLSSHLNSQITSLHFQQNFLTIAPTIQPTDQQNKRTIFNLISIKKHSIQILIKCIKVLIKKKNSKFNDYPYLNGMISGLWLKVKDCLLLETQKYLKNIETASVNNINAQMTEMKKQLQDLFSTATKFLSQSVKMSSMYNLVSPYQGEIIFKLCYPWLISRKQHDRFQAEDYLFFRQDLINKQNMSYIENTIGSLIESYLDNIDGSITSIMTNCTQLVSYHLTKNPQLLQNITPQLKNSWCIEFYPIQRQIQSALTLISVESYLSLQRNDIALMLQKWLQSHKHFFLSIENDYRITVQFLMLYSYYADNFYSNLIQGISSQNFEYRQLHQQVLKYCCYLMKANYNYEKNTYNGRVGQILYFIALDCLNNSLNHTEIVYALYCHFPPKDQLSIPHYMLPYENYPFYPIKKLFTSSNKKTPLQLGQKQSFLNPTQRKQKQEEQTKHQMKQLLVHYRKIGLNRDEYIEKDQLIYIIQFLADNLQTRANLKIIQIFIEFLIGYVREQMKNQGALINVPIIFRENIATQLAIKTYALIHSKPQQFPNRGQFETKATQLIYVLHTISTDAYYIYSLGLDVVWMNSKFWNFDPMEDDNNIDKLLKCTDLVVRLALKHYTSEKGVNLSQLMQKIALTFTQHSYQYIKKMHKFNIIFGILLNLILLKISPQKMFDFLYLLITEKLMKAELQYDQYQVEQNQKQSEIPPSSASDLLSLAFYLFLVNIYRNPQCLNTQKNFQLLTVFQGYLTHYVNAQQIVTQLGDVFGKVFACCLCIIEKEFLKDTLNNFDKNKLEFLWRNILYSGKIYKTELETRVVSIKLLSMIKEIIKRNDPQFPLERLQLMYQTACSCVFYSKNKDFLMANEEEGYDEDFDHAGEEQEWQNLPITLIRNDTEMYIEDDVLLLKAVSRELLQSGNVEKKQWVTRLIEGLPVAVRNFVKNKVINYEQESKQIGLRKIMKVKRPQGIMQNATTKQEIIKENKAFMKKHAENESDEEK